MTEVVLLTTTEVAKRFRVDTSVVRRWVSSGKLKPAITTPGGHYRIKEEDLRDFMRRYDFLDENEEAKKIG